ncbi:MAG: hypothetical protein ABJA10_05570, partial [Aestuariivirga sp.]
MRKCFFAGFAFLLLFLVPVARAESAWPIVPIDEPTATTTDDENLKDPGTSQPLNFDPAKFKSLSGVANFQSKNQIKLVGGMLINAYYFDTDDDQSYVLDVRDGESRHALYTQVLNYRVVAGKSLLIENMLLVKTPKQTGGLWQHMNRLIDIATKKATSFPNVDCAKFFAPEPSNGIVTYGQGTKDGDSFGPPRNVCIWDTSGKLIKAYSAPIQNILANSEETSNGIGVLPADQDTFYQLAFDKDHCVMRLQSLSDKNKHRQISLPEGQ